MIHGDLSSLCLRFMKRSVVLFLLVFFMFSVFTVRSQVTASFMMDTSRVKSYSVLFTALDTVAGYVYVWDLGDSMRDTGTVVEHHYPGAATYHVVLTVTDPTTHISDTARRTVVVRDVLEVPNVFTPNNDSRNDLFVVRSNGTDVFTLTVFTPSGVKVCETRGQTVVWDGRTSAGNLVSPGVYYYILRSDKGIHRNGFVHVIY